MLVVMELASDFSAGCALLMIVHTFLMTHPPPTHNSRIGPANVNRSNGERGRCYVGCPVLSIRYMRLGHKLVDVVIVAVVYAMDVAQPTVPACPLPITNPTLSEGRHPTTIDKQTVAEVEVLYFYPMLT